MEPYKLKIGNKIFVAGRPRNKVLRLFLEMTKEDSQTIDIRSYDKWQGIVLATFPEMTAEDFDNLYADKLTEVIEKVAEYLSDAMTGEQKN